MERIGIIAAVAILVALLIASVAVALLRGEPELDAGSPEDAVQRYVRALADGDYEAMRAMWAPEVRERCPLEDVATGGWYGGYAPFPSYTIGEFENTRLTLEDVYEAGDVTNVRLEAIETRGGGLFGPSGYSRHMVFSLRQYDGEWLIVRHNEPWIKCFSEPEDVP